MTLRQVASPYSGPALSSNSSLLFLSHAVQLSKCFWGKTVIVLFLPHILDLAVGSEAFHCPNRLRHRESVFYTVLRADTATMTHPTVEHCGGI